MSPDDEALLGLADLVVPGLLEYAQDGDRYVSSCGQHGSWPCHRDLDGRPNSREPSSGAAPNQSPNEGH